MCTFYNNVNQPVSANDIGLFAADITAECGRYIAGTAAAVYRTGDLLGFNVGYMRYSTGLNFCKNSMTSGQNCCN